MGLDMYLKKNHYIAASYEHRKVKAQVEITIDGVPVNIDATKICYITEDAGYWRKANAIHAWFVANIQDNKDDCREYDVSYEELLALKKLCKKVLRTKDASILPPTAGFFFGSTVVDEFYYENLKDTVKIVEALDPECDYTYRASW